MDSIDEYILIFLTVSIIYMYIFFAISFQAILIPNFLHIYRELKYLREITLNNILQYEN